MIRLKAVHDTRIEVEGDVKNLDIEADACYVDDGLLYAN